MKLVHNQIGPDCKLLDSCLCWGVALDMTGLNNPDSVPNAKMNSIHMGPDSDNMTNHNPDALSIEVAYPALDIQIGKQGPCSGQRYQPAKTGICYDEGHDAPVCYMENRYPAEADICLDYKDKP